MPTWLVQAGLQIKFIFLPSELRRTKTNRIVALQLGSRSSSIGLTNKFYVSTDHSGMDRAGMLFSVF
jgi:hypothetical protein